MTAAKSIRAYRVSPGIGLFKLGIETYMAEDEAHFVWGSQTIARGRIWCVSLGFWEIAWGGTDD